MLPAADPPSCGNCLKVGPQKNWHGGVVCRTIKDRSSFRLRRIEVATVPPHLPHRRWTRLKSWMMENLWASWAAHHFQKTLELFQPDAAWVIPNVWAIAPLAQVLLKSKTGFHTTVQDYVDARNNISRLGINRTQRLAVSADELYSHATTRDATSHPMIEDLRSHTAGEAAQMLHAGFEKNDFAYLSTKRRPLY